MNQLDQPVVEIRLVCRHCKTNTARYSRLRASAPAINRHEEEGEVLVRDPDPFPTACSLCAMNRAGEYARMEGFNPLDYAEDLLHPQPYCTHNNTYEPVWMCTPCYDNATGSFKSHFKK